MSHTFHIKQKEERHFNPLRMRGPISEKSACGKTVKEIIRHGSSLIFMFEDNSFMVVASDDCAECGEPPCISIATRLTDLMPQQLLRAGAITQEQFDQWAEERDRERVAKNEALERHQFEQLKKKFEPEPSRPLFVQETA